MSGVFRSFDNAVAEWCPRPSVWVGRTEGQIGVPDRIASEDTALVADLYEDARRFAAVVAPWDIDPDDVLHASLVSILRRGRLHDTNDPPAYLRRAIVNEVRSEIRRRSSRRKSINLLRASTPDRFEGEYPSDLADLMQLRPVARAVIYLHDVEGLPFDKVASAVGITAGNARVTAARARRRLRTALAREEVR